MMRINPVFLLASLTGLLGAQSLDLAPVVSKPVSRTVDVPGELLPFLSVSLHAKVSGYVERILVDRGSAVKTGDLLVELSAPELKTQLAEAESRVQTAEAERLQAEAQVAAAESTHERLKQASATVGAVAGNELVQAEQQLAAARALARARLQAGLSAEAAARVHRDMQAYLRIVAPFDGVVTERPVHPGALVGPATGPLFLVQQVSRLRLVVAVPEEFTGGIVNGARVPFRVPAFPERVNTGTIARVAGALDAKTRTMPVELDVVNREGLLAPGMYCAVKWPVRRAQPALFVPRTSVVTTSERTFVIRNAGGRAEWVDVKKGAVDGEAIEVTGSLRAGDQVVRRATDEIREGTTLQPTK